MTTTDNRSQRTQPQDNALAVRGLTKTFPITRSLLGRVLTRVHAVNDVEFIITPGHTLGLVGESGSGKTTVGRMVSQLTPADSGEIVIDGHTIGKSTATDKSLRRTVQVVLQDPFSSLDPTKTVGHAVEEPLHVRKVGASRSRRARALAMLERVGLGEEHYDRYPAELSGGQRQRVCVARALVLEPAILVADEPTSALDLSTRSEILNLLLDLQSSMGVSILLISHDFATIGHLSHQIAVMYLGEIVEEGPSADLVDNPLHPYTQALVSAVPSIEAVGDSGARRIPLSGEIPNPIDPPPGCRFNTRCPLAAVMCTTQRPELQTAEGEAASRRVACHAVNRRDEHEASPRLNPRDPISTTKPE